MIHLSSSDAGASTPLPGLRPGVTLVTHGDEAELRDNALGQVVRLGEAAAVIISLLDGERDAAQVLLRAGQVLGGPLDPMGLVDLLQALDQRALLNTPRARAAVSQGLVRADVAALRRLSQRSRPLMQFAANSNAKPQEVRMASGSQFSCNSCTRCCTSKHLLGPVSADEVQKILEGFKKIGQPARARASDFIPLGNDGGRSESFLLRTENGRCTFLQGDGRCSIHEQLGVELKPGACRIFPFRPVRTVTGWDVGLSMSCPTVVKGSGGDASNEALQIVKDLAQTSPLLEVLTDTVQLDANCTVPYELYRDWEEQSVTALLQEDQDPTQTWVGIVEAFEAILKQHESHKDDPWLSLAESDDCSTVEMSQVNSPDALHSDRGQGQISGDVGHAADILLRDLAIWLELLIGLEAANPMALRRVRRGVIRIRSDLDVSPLSAPVLAERARLSQLADDTADTLGDDPESTNSSPLTATRPAIRSVESKKTQTDEVQRRFLVQALIGKSLFRYSTVRHGLLAFTVHVKLLGLEHMNMDPFCLEVEDISYLFQHPQFIDVIDSRATVRHHSNDGSIHRSILGVGYSF